MPLSPFQKAVDDSEKRFKLVVGGRRIGKTRLAMRTIAKYAKEPGVLVFAVYPTYRQGKMVLWDPLKDKLRRLNWIKKINETELSIQLVNGSKIMIKGSEQSDSLRGVKISGGCVFDEMADIGIECWEILRPAMADTKAPALFLGTPRGQNHFYDMYQQAKTMDDWGTWSITSAEGGFIDPEEIETARAVMDKNTFEQEFYGTFVNSSGSVYKLFDSNLVNYSPNQVTKDSVIYCGIDLNINPMSCCVADIQGGKIHFHDEIEIMSSNTDELAQEIRQRYPSQKIVCYPDPAGAARKTNSNVTDHQILRQHGFEVRARHKHPAIRDRINCVNSLIKNVKGETRLYLDPKRCKRTIECLNKITYKQGTNLPDKDSGFDHMVDALGYMCEFEFPIQSPKRNDIPRSWGIRTV